MKTHITFPILVVLSIACAGGCERKANHQPQPSLNTVNPDTHEPYQERQPATTGNPMSDTDSVPDHPGDEAEALDRAAAKDQR